MLLGLRQRLQVTSTLRQRKEMRAELHLEIFQSNATDRTGATVNGRYVGAGRRILIHYPSSIARAIIAVNITLNIHTSSVID